MARGVVVLEQDRCKACSLCIDICPPRILRLSDTTFNAKGYPPIEVTEMDACTGCSVCAVICPDVVFTVYRQRPRSRQLAGAA